MDSLPHECVPVASLPCAALEVVEDAGAGQGFLSIEEKYHHGMALLLGNLLDLLPPFLGVGEAVNSGEEERRLVFGVLQDLAELVFAVGVGGGVCEADFICLRCENLKELLMLLVPLLHSHPLRFPPCCPAFCLKWRGPRDDLDRAALRKLSPRKLSEHLDVFAVGLTRLKRYESLHCSVSRTDVQGVIKVAGFYSLGGSVADL